MSHTSAAGDMDTSEKQVGRRPNERKMRVGVVVSDKPAKTVVVAVERQVAHRYYGKQVTRTRKYYAHDETNKYHLGDIVRIVETRPLSKLKRWRVVELIESAR